jgi:hypothetical protein
MRKTMLLALVLCAFSGAYAQTMQMRPVHLRPMQIVILRDRITPLFARHSMRLTPRGRAWVAAESQRLRSGALDPSQVGIEADQNCGMAFGSCVGGADIEALAFIVLMQATADQGQDLESIMAGVKAQTNAKARLRGEMGQMKALNARQVNNVPNAHQINLDVSNLQNDLDSMSEMGEMESMRLQMAMDRLSKLMTALSNIEKKTDDTDNSIIKNMK